MATQLPLLIQCHLYTSSYVHVQVHVITVNNHTKVGPAYVLYTLVCRQSLSHLIMLSLIIMCTNNICTCM